MADDIWLQYKTALRRGRPSLNAYDPNGRHSRLEGVIGGQSVVPAYREVWFFVETQYPIMIKDLTVLLHHLRSVETLDAPFYKPPFHLCFWKNDKPEFFRMKSMILKFNTSFIAWADYIAKEIDQINKEKDEQGASGDEPEFRMERTLKRITREDLTVFVAAKPIETIKSWIEPLIQNRKMENLSFVSFMPEQIECSFGKTLLVRKREESLKEEGEC